MKKLYKEIEGKHFSMREKRCLQNHYLCILTNRWCAFSCICGNGAVGAKQQKERYLHSYLLVPTINNNILKLRIEQDYIRELTLFLLCGDDDDAAANFFYVTAINFTKQHHLYDGTHQPPLLFEILSKFKKEKSKFERFIIHRYFE